jgi:hypothetical protein
MASAGIRKRVSARTRRVSYQVWWLLDDGSQGATTVATGTRPRSCSMRSDWSYVGAPGEDANAADSRSAPGRPNGGTPGRRRPQPDHARRRRNPAPAARATLVRRPTDRQDHPRRRAPLASATGPEPRTLHGGPLPVAGTADLPVRHGRGRDRHQPSPQGPSAQAPSRSRAGLRRGQAARPHPRGGRAGCWPVSRCSGGTT